MSTPIFLNNITITKIIYENLDITNELNKITDNNTICFNKMYKITDIYGDPFPKKPKKVIIDYIENNKNDNKKLILNEYMGYIQDECYIKNYTIKHLDEIKEAPTQPLKNKPKICIYTAIYGDYDKVQIHEKQTIECDYIYISDKDLKNDYGIKTYIYDQHPLSIKNHPILEAKYVRFFPQKIPILKNYDILIYLDGNCSIISPNLVEDLIKKYDIYNYDIALSEHPYFDNIADELLFARNYIKYDKYNLERLGNDYYNENPNFNIFNKTGLYSSGFIVYNLKSQYILNELSYMWWNEIIKYMESDDAFPECQVCLSYCLWKLNINTLKLSSKFLYGDTNKYINVPRRYTI